MTKTARTIHGTGNKGRIEGVSAADRTRVIILSQVVVIVALVILWSILRARRSGA